MKGLLFVVLHAAVVSSQDITTEGRYDYIVSIPDVHGDLEALLRALWMAKAEVDDLQQEHMYESKFRKIFISAIKNEPFETMKAVSDKKVLLIQTGDIIDRGEASLSCYKAMWQIQPILGWEVINLVGNHEVMTIAGRADHYAHPNDVKEFGSIKSRRAAFAPGGQIWTKITNEFQFLARVNIGESESILFVHAGIDPSWLKKVSSGGSSSVSSINSLLMNELKTNPNSKHLTSASSPIWTRDLANGSAKKVCENLLPKVFEMLKITRIVVGHTPQEQLVVDPKCGGQLILADVAMSRWMGSGPFGNPAAVVFALANNGAHLKRIQVNYWKGETQKVFEQLLFESQEEVENNEL